MAADNDLEPAAMNSLAELQQFEGAGAIRVAAQIDRRATRCQGRQGGARAALAASLPAIDGSGREEQNHGRFVCLRASGDRSPKLGALRQH